MNNPLDPVAIATMAMRQGALAPTTSAQLAPPPVLEAQAPPASTAAAVDPVASAAPAKRAVSTADVRAMLRHPATHFAATFLLACIVLYAINPGFVQGAHDPSAPPGVEPPRSVRRVLVWSLIFACVGAAVPLVVQHWAAIKSTFTSLIA